MSRNTFPADCYKCGKPVQPGDGYNSGKDDAGNWRLVHETCIPVAIPEDWTSIARARLRALVEALERMDPEDLDTIRSTPGAALLREWIGRTPPKLEYDL